MARQAMSDRLNVFVEAEGTNPKSSAASREGTRNAYTMVGLMRLPPQSADEAPQAE